MEGKNCVIFVSKFFLKIYWARVEQLIATPQELFLLCEKK